uniref:Uncharacterized protein n=1 Tax=Rhizobium phage LG08 TaxID=3129229 RepID=A0AAU8HYU8_9CAUD
MLISRNVNTKIETRTFKSAKQLKSNLYLFSRRYLQRKWRVPRSCSTQDSPVGGA